MRLCRYCQRTDQEISRVLRGGDGVCAECDERSPWLDDLIDFAFAIDKELRENTDEGKPWAMKREDLRHFPEYDKRILLDMYYHVGKLQAALIDQDPERMYEHVADVGATAFIFYDTAGGLHA